MKKYTIYLLLIAAVIAGLYALPHRQAPDTAGVTQDQNAAPNITVEISSTTYPLYVPPGSSVVDAMRLLASSTDVRFSGQEYEGIGMFINSINGKENADGNYWFMYVNGTSSQTGASQTIIKDGDVIEWRYQKSE